MALTKDQRDQLIGLIVANKSFERSQLTSLTDNQLVALNDPAKLDMVVNAAKKPSMEEFEDEAIMNEYKSRFGKGKVKGKDKDEEVMNEEMEDEEEMEEDDDNDEEESKAPISANRWFAQAPQEIRQIVANARRIENERREVLIDKIVTNGICPLNTQELKQRSTEDLEVFAAMAGGSPSDSFNYMGAAGSVTTNSRTKVQPLGVPTAEYMS